MPTSPPNSAPARRPAGRPSPAGLLALALAIALLPGGPGRADVPATRQGAVHDGRKAQMLGGLTVTAQEAEGAAGPELLASVDMVADLTMGPGVWTLYVEGNTSPQADGVVTRLPAANADAGTALDAEGKGRLQVSELYYSWRAGRWLTIAGLLDPTSFLDRSAVANDETTQFLAAPLVNNPAIAFPDYTLGAAAHRDHPGGWLPGWTFLVAGSHGLAGQAERSYAELFDLDEPGEGAFVAAQAYWQGMRGSLRLGGWTQSERQARRDRATGKVRNAGVYGVLDWTGIDGIRLNLRAGWARPAASRVQGFLGLSGDYRLGAATLGAGLTRSWVADRRDRPGDTGDQAEVYLRWPVRANGHLTPHLQWQDPAHGPARWIAGARSTWTF